MVRAPRFVPVVAGVALALFATAEAHAQTCLGQPMKQGSSVTRVGLALPHNADTEKYGDGVQVYGFDVRSNMLGPVTVGARYDLARIEVDADEFRNGHEFAVLGAFELPLPLLGLSVCPMMEPGYFRFSIAEEGSELTLTQLSVPVGVGVGFNYTPIPMLSVTPFAVPQIVVGSMGMKLTGPIEGEDSESYNALGGVVGLTLGFDRFFVSGSWSLHKVKVGDAEERADQKSLRFSASVRF